MNKQTFLSGFNNHFTEFLEDVQHVFPDDPDVSAAKKSLLMLRKMNPKMIVTFWHESIVGKYKKEIEEGNVSFFITKDYSQDVAVSENSEKIMNAINRLRDQICSMNEENQKKSMIYIQNLTKLSTLYFS
jgi:hypothetical protein